MNAAPPAQRGNVMTDAGVPGRDPSAASAPAAAWAPPTGQNPVPTMVGTSRYVSSATFYCRAATFKASLNGTPAQ